MAKKTLVHLSRRERQLMDVVYAMGEATAYEVLDCLPDPPSYSAVRALLRILENKGHLKHKKRGARYLFYATKPRTQAARIALKQMLMIYYDQSVENLVTDLMKVAGSKLSKADRSRIAAKVNRGR